MLDPRVLALLVFLYSCSVSQESFKKYSESGFVVNVAHLNPDLPNNKVDNDTVSSELIITISGDKVIDELVAIEELDRSIEKIIFIRSNQSFSNFVYLVRLQRGLNPVPYYDFLRTFDGVLSVEYDAFVGVAAREK